MSPAAPLPDAPRDGTVIPLPVLVAGAASATIGQGLAHVGQGGTGRPMPRMPESGSTQLREFAAPGLEYPVGMARRVLVGGGTRFELQGISR